MPNHQRCGSASDVLKRVGDVHRWLSNETLTHPTPSHWTVNSAISLRDGWMGHGLSSGSHKRVYQAHLEDAHQPIPVVVKRSTRDGPQTEPRVHAEILYLEHLRCKAGVPFLYGGWAENGTVHYVVQHAGSLIGGGLQVVHLSASYLQAAARYPFELAGALLRCFQSFGEGGYFLEDFLPKQFALQRPTGEGVAVYLVDGPKVLSGPVYDLLSSEPQKFKKALWSARQSCRADRDCPATKWSHCCCLTGSEACPRGSVGAPEAQGQCNFADATVGTNSPNAAGRCAAISERTVLFDVAGKSWLLPRLALVDPVLERLIAPMREQRAEARPSFGQVLQALEMLPSNRTHTQQR